MPNRQCVIRGRSDHEVIRATGPLGNPTREPSVSKVTEGIESEMLICNPHYWFIQANGCQESAEHTFVPLRTSLRKLGEKFICSGLRRPLHRGSHIRDSNMPHRGQEDLRLLGQDPSNGQRARTNVRVSAELASRTFQSIAVGHRFEFHANRVGDGDHRASFECESRQH